MGRGVRIMESERSEMLASYQEVSYSLPRFHKGKNPYVDFYQVDPRTLRMRRKKFPLRGVRDAVLLEQRAADLVALLTELLHSGWNVWDDATRVSAGPWRRAEISWENLARTYRKEMSCLCSRGILKLSTLETYFSYFGCFEEFLRFRLPRVRCAGDLDRGLLVEFLDYLFFEQRLSARTRNNYLTWFRTFVTFLLDKGYTSSNFTQGVRKLREAPKFREQMSADELRRICGYLREKDPWFLLACMFEYYTFIRPEELCSVRLGDIYLREQKVYLSGRNTKNRRDGMVGLNRRTIDLMLDLGVFDFPDSYFLFGTCRFRPGPTRKRGAIFRNRWVLLRGELDLPPCYQFYSLKDTGIRDLANARGIIVARDQARHADVRTTNRYLKGLDLTVHEETKTFEGAL